MHGLHNFSFNIKFNGGDFFLPQSVLSYTIFFGYGVFYSINYIIGFNKQKKICKKKIIKQKRHHK